MDRFPFVALGSSEEGLCLLRSQRRLLSSHTPRRVHQGRDIALDWVPLDGTIQGNAQHGADISSCRERQHAFSVFVTQGSLRLRGVRLPSSIDLEPGPTFFRAV